MFMMHFFITSEDIYHKIFPASALPYFNSFKCTVAACQLLPPNKCNTVPKFYFKYQLDTCQISLQ